MKIKLLILLLAASLNLLGSSQSSIENDFNQGMTLLDKYSGHSDTLKLASEHFRRIYEQDKEHPLALIGFSRLLYKGAFQRGKQYDQVMLSSADLYMRHALAVAPQNYEVNYYASLYYLQIVEDEVEAKNHYKITQNLQPNSEKSQSLRMLFTSSEPLANKLVHSSNYGVANNAYSVLKRIYKKSPNKMEELHLASIKLGKKHNVNTAWDYFSYAWFLVYTKREFAKAEQILKLSKEQMVFGVQDELESEIKFRQGYQFLWKKKPADYRKAIALFEQCETLYKRHRKVFYNKAIALYYLGLKTHKETYIYQARECILKAQEINPKYGEVAKYMKEIENTIHRIETT